MTYHGSKRLDYTRIHQTGASRTRYVSGTGKQAGKGTKSIAKGLHKPRHIPMSLTNSMRRWEEEDKKNHKKGAEEVIQAILLWLKESLPEMLKRAINFDAKVETTTYADPKVPIRLNTDYTSGRRAFGEIEFTESQVFVSCSESRFSRSDWRIGVDYADPHLFEKLQGLLSRFYNGL